MFFNPTELIFWPLNQMKGIFPVPKTTRKNRDFVPFISNRDFQNLRLQRQRERGNQKQNCKCVLKVCTASSRPLLWGRNHSEKLSMFRFRTLRYLYMSRLWGRTGADGNDKHIKPLMKFLRIMWFDFFNRPILGVFCLSSLIIYPQKTTKNSEKIWKYLLT